MLRAGIAIVCLLAVPVILPAQSCPGAPDYPEITGSLACPDGADSTVYSSAVPVATPEEPFNPDRSATIDSPPEVGSGSRFYVEWSGPANAGDYIAVAAPGSSGGDYRNYSYVEDGSPLQLVAPDEPGDYEVRYVQRDSRDILARQEVAVSEAAATVEFVSQIDSGSNFDVTWTGPGNPSDYIAIAAPDTTGGEYRNYAYVQDGSPLQLTAPDEPGAYEVRYVQHQSRTILASRPVTVAAVPATLNAADSIDSGSPFDVTWTGPGNPSDYIAIATPGTPGSSYHNYAYVQDGSPLQVTAPDEPGNYEIRYVQHQSRTVLAARAIEVAPVSATIRTGAVLKAGASFDVNWTGPGNQSDYITIATPGTTGNDYHNYAYVQQGSPLQLTAPAEQGTYEVRYIQRQSRTILARQTVQVEN